MTVSLGKVLMLCQEENEAFLGDCASLGTDGMYPEWLESDKVTPLWLPCPLPGGLSDPGMELASSALQVDSLPLIHQGTLRSGVNWRVFDVEEITSLFFLSLVFWPSLISFTSLLITSSLVALESLSADDFWIETPNLDFLLSPRFLDTIAHWTSFLYA